MVTMAERQLCQLVLRQGSSPPPFLYHEYGDCVLLLEHGLQVNNVSHITLCLAEIWSLLVYLNSMIAPFFL
jgi:hypothetical protein